MGRKSTIARLPLDVKAYIEAMLATGAQTLDELIVDLQARFPAASHGGNLPSRSALHRYGSKLDRRLSAIKASTEAAKLIQAQAGDDQDARSEALTALVQTELFEAILSLQEADDPESKADPGERVAMLSSAAKNIATLTRSSIGLKQFQAQARARAKAAAETVDKIAKSGGLSGDAAEQIRREILGIAA
ncbi:MAG: hypothetical protein A2503_10025 [Burkholderiales bacterium RIFOXYD12_FULL_59_19]|nr:MAG: hypothetical protein A2503_10025 [Burkholderiales bacterium RIFOXYD12_FULL_59_19]